MNAVIALVLALGIRVGPVNTCEERAELAWHISGGTDAAWEDAYQACADEPKLTAAEALRVTRNAPASCEVTYAQRQTDTHSDGDRNWIAVCE